MCIMLCPAEPGENEFPVSGQLSGGSGKVQLQQEQIPRQIAKYESCSNEERIEAKGMEGKK